jgi:hypothetical protein
MSTSMRKTNEGDVQSVQILSDTIDSANTVDIIDAAVQGGSVEIQETRWHRARNGIAQFLAVIALPFLIIHFMLELVGVVTVYYILPLVSLKQPISPNPRITKLPDMLWLMWDHFDSGFYLNIAHSGYWGKETLHQMSNWVFFPLYPLLIRLTASPFGTGDDTYRFAGIFVSNVMALVACSYLYKLTKHEFGSNVAARAVIYLLLFPMSFYLSAIYTESLFLALTVGCMYYARTRRWWLAGIFGGLASLTRPQGILLLVVVAWEYWQYLGDQFAPMHMVTGIVARGQEWSRSRLLGLKRALAAWRTWPGFVALLLIPLGLGLFCLYAQWKVGSFFAFQESEYYGWGYRLSNPIMLVLHMLHHPRPTSPYDWTFYGLAMTLIIAFFLLAIPIFRKLPPVYGIFTLLALIMPLTLGKLNGIGRYYMVVFPIYMLLAWWTSRGNVAWSERKHTLLVASFAILLALGMAMFTLGIYSLS